jgi:hypothetical protein
MGLFDLFRFGKVMAHTARAVKHQRDAAAQLRELPVDQLVARALEGLHSPHASWKATPRTPRADAQEFAASKRLPAELAEFYRVCDGFEATADFPARVLPLGDIMPGADVSPPLSQRALAFWKEHGNDSDEEGMLMVLPPDDLGALVANAAESHLPAAALDRLACIVPPEEARFVVIALDAAGPALPAGSVLDYENGIATRYDGFRHWLATRATLFESPAGVSCCAQGDKQ